MAVADARPIPETGRRSERREQGLLARIAHHWADYVYVLPSLLVMLVVIGYPIVYTIFLSFHDTPARSGEWIFNGGENFPRILSNPLFWKITGNTMAWTFGLAFTSASISSRDLVMITRGCPGGDDRLMRLSRRVRCR